MLHEGRSGLMDAVQAGAIYLPSAGAVQETPNGYNDAQPMFCACIVAPR